jgi:hypothetical protein
MKLFLAIVRYGEPLSYEVRTAWHTFKQAYSRCVMLAHSVETRKDYLPESAQIYILDTDNLELAYTTIDKGG